MTLNIKKWWSMAWQWMVTVAIFWVAVKIFGFIVGLFISDNLIASAGPSAFGQMMANTLRFLKSDVILGLLLCLFVAHGAQQSDKKAELKVAVGYSVVIVILMAVYGLLTQGLNADFWGYIFYLECAPAWAFAMDMFASWEADQVNKRNPGGIIYNDTGDFQRGARVAHNISSAQVPIVFTARETPKGGREGIRVWNDHPFPFTRENQHFLIVGSPGAGKTQIIYPMIDQAFKRGDKAIVWDIKGTFIQAYCNQPGVDLLAAWDKRSMAWSPGSDIRSELDCQQIASIVFPPNPRDSQPFFLNSARQILEAIFVYLDSQGAEWGWGDVWSIISMPRQEIAKLLSSFEDGKALSNVIGAETKSAEDVYSTLVGHSQQNVRWFAKAWPKGTISLRKWVHSDSKMLVIGGIPERTDLAQATANMALDIITNEMLSISDDLNRRVWLFVDELATLGKLTSLLNAFSLGRSKGLCVVAGIQDIGKLEHHYGPQLAKSITNTFSTQMILRCSDHVTAEWASKALGEQDVIITQESTSSGSSDGKSTSSTSQSEVHKTRAVFLPSEISNFENMTGVLKVSGWPLLRAKWLFNKIPETQSLVVEADWLKKKEKPLEKKPEEKPQDPPRHSKTDEPEKPKQASSWRVD